MLFFFTPVKKWFMILKKMLVEDNPNFEKACIYNTNKWTNFSNYCFQKAVSVMYSQMSVFNKAFDLSEVTVSESGEEPVELKN